MGYFRLFLAVCLLALPAYTCITISRHGWDLLSIFFGDVAAMAWPGQFKFDFLTFLLLSGLWTAWRNDFRLAGPGPALLAVFGGILFLPAYLRVLSYRTNDNVAAMLPGSRRVPN